MFCQRRCTSERRTGWQLGVAVANVAVDREKVLTDERNLAVQ